MEFLRRGPPGSAPHARSAKVRTVPAQQPQLRHELSVVEHPHRRALRDRHGLSSARYGGGGHVAAAEPQVQLQVLGGRVDVASPRENHTPVRYHERPVELGELFKSLAQVWVFYALALVGVAVQGIEDHGPGVPQDRLRVAHHEEGADLAPLPSRALSTARFTTLLSVLLFTPRLSEQISSSNRASGPVLSGTPPPPSDEPVLPDASSTALSSPSRSI